MGNPSLPLTVTIICRDEERCIGRAIESVRSWADDVVVVDSGSSDRTVEIARSLGARVFEREWPGYGQQKNFAQEQARHDWILSLDADEWVSPGLAAEIEKCVSTAADSGPKAYSMPRKTYYLGQWIRHGGWYPNRLVRLSDRRFARWSEPEVHEQLVVRGEIRALDTPLEHDSFASIQDQVLINLRYSSFGSRELAQRGAEPSLVKLALKPIGKFFETFVLKRGFLDGVAGFIISVNAAHSVFLKHAYLFEPRIRKSIAP